MTEQIKQQVGKLFIPEKPLEHRVTDYVSIPLQHPFFPCLFLTVFASSFDILHVLHFSGKIAQANRNL